VQASGASPRQTENHHEEDAVHHEEVHDESNWLVSYADMMTLLFGFFVLMYSMSKIDKEKYEVISKDMAKYMGGKLTEKPINPVEKMTKINDEIKVVLASAFENKSDYNVKLNGDSLVVTLDSDLLFPSGSARPTEKAVEVVNKVYDSVKNQKVEQIEVEGHTDSDPISTATFPSNWELSTSRAASIVRIFENLDVPVAQLKASGFGESRPLVSEVGDSLHTSKENKAKNRRVVINLKIDPINREIKDTLEKQGLKTIQPPAAPEVPKAAVAASDPNAPNASPNDIAALQEKHKQMQERLKEANQKLAAAQAEERKRKELENLIKKNQELESKIQQVQKKADETKMKVEQAPK
jgi:chemotaxis protein MotB